MNEHKINTFIDSVNFPGGALDWRLYWISDLLTSFFFMNSFEVFKGITWRILLIILMILFEVNTLL